MLRPMHLTSLLACAAALLAAGCRPAPPSGPADPHATPETRALYRNLGRVARTGVLFGHQDDALYGCTWSYEAGGSDVRACCGDYPAVFGWELGGLEIDAARSLDSVPFTEIVRLLCAAAERGSVQTISWHARNPETGGSTWDNRSATAVRSILPGGDRHTLYCGWLDRLAAFFDALRRPDGTPIPVLFRPFHEHTGSGFWWGEAQCTAEEYVALWRFTVGYLRDAKDIHHLLYVYSPDLFRDADHYLERYPGDEWVDVLGLDAYDRPEERDFRAGCDRMLGILAQLGRAHAKPTAFTETGLEGIPEPRWWTERLLPAIRGKGLSYVLVWRNAHDRPGHFFGPCPGHASEPDFRRFAANREQPVLFESRLPDMYR